MAEESQHVVEDFLRNGVQEERIFKFFLLPSLRRWQYFFGGGIHVDREARGRMDSKKNCDASYDSVDALRARKESSTVGGKFDVEGGEQSFSTFGSDELSRTVKNIN